mgnify:CR=1 FL=1
MLVKVNGKKISNETLQGVYAYFSAYVFVFGISVLLVALDNFDFATTISGVLTTLSNVGPGISRVGPIENFQSFSVLSKIVFSMDMLIGRLEIFPFLMICSPSFWRKHFLDSIVYKKFIKYHQTLFALMIFLYYTVHYNLLIYRKWRML